MTERDDDRLMAKIMVASLFAAGLDRALTAASREEATPAERDQHLATALYNISEAGEVLNEIANLKPNLLKSAGWIGDFMSLPFSSRADIGK